MLTSACPTANGRMFRTRPNIQAITAPPTNVSGTSTGFGQWHAAKITPVTPPLIEFILYQRHHAVVDQRIERHLLQQAKCGVAE